MTTEQLKLTGERVRIARESRGWSQERLAHEANVAPNTVGSIELGKKKAWGRNLRAVLDALDLASLEDEATLDLAGVPADVRTFLKAITGRASAMDESVRTRLLAQLYPQILDADAMARDVSEGSAAYRSGKADALGVTPEEVGQSVTRKPRRR